MTTRRVTRSEPSDGFYNAVLGTATSANTTIEGGSARAGSASAHRMTTLQSAVYSHIRALRALGRTSVDTGEIARALGVSVNDVNSTLEALRAKGVRFG